MIRVTRGRARQNPHRSDNGIQFTKREGTEGYWTIPFDRLCDTLGIEHRLTKVNHPWTNGQPIAKFRLTQIPASYLVSSDKGTVADTSIVPKSFT